MELFPHQKLNFAQMKEFEEKKSVVINDGAVVQTDIGVLSGHPGSGKTVALVHMLASDIPLDIMIAYRTINLFIWGNNHFMRKVETIYRQFDCNLILINKTDIKQWEYELNLVSLKFRTVHTRKTMAEMTPDIIRTLSVVLITPDFFNRFVKEFDIYAWRRIILDEPQHIHVSAMKTGIALFTWIVSSSPYSIKSGRDSSPHFLKDIASAWNKSRLLEYLIINNPVKLPELNVLKYRCKSNVRYNIYSTHIAELVEQNRVVDAIKALNIPNKIEEVKSTDCIICFETVSIPISETTCGKLFCGKCLLRWVKDRGNCPHCRAVIDWSRLISYNIEKDTLLSKQQTILNIITDIQKHNNRRIMLFSNSENTPVYLEEANVKFMINVNKYKALNSDAVLLLTPITINFCLNLETITDVIIPQTITGELFNQVVGRVNQLSKLVSKRDQLNIHVIEY